MLRNSNNDKIKKIKFGSTDIKIKKFFFNTIKIFSAEPGIFQGSSSLINGQWFKYADAYESYDAGKHISQSFSMPSIRWDNSCSHGTWCDSTSVATFYYPLELGPNFIQLSQPTVACDGCHWGSGIVEARASPGTYGLPSNAIPLADIQVDYSYFTFARTIYIVI